MSTDNIKNLIFSSDIYNQAIADGNVDASELSLLSKELGVDTTTISSILSGASIFTATNTKNNTSAGAKDDGNEFVYKKFNEGINSSDLTNMTEDDFINMAQTNKDDSGFWANIFEAGAENIYEMLNTDNQDGLSEKELLALSGLDKNQDNISSKDLQNFFLKNDVSITTKNIKDAEKRYKNINKSEYGDSDPTIEQIDAARSNAIQSKSIDEQIIETEDYIKTAENDLAQTIKDNTGTINESEVALNELIQSLTFEDPATQELQQEYNSLETQITTNNTNISNTKQDIITNKSDTTAAKGELTSLEAQLAALEVVTTVDDPENDIEGQKTTLRTQITTTKTKISDLEKELSDVLEPQLTAQEEEQTRLEGDKQRVMGDILSSSEMNSIANQGIQSQILAQQGIIDAAKSAIEMSESTTEGILSEQNAKLMELKTTEGTSKGISAGSTAAGIELTEYAKNVAANMNSSGWCLRGVAAAIHELTGEWPYSATNDASGSVPWFESNPEMFTDITSQVTSQEDIDNLPPGAIVVYERTDNAVWGHIEVRLGPGQACSDNFNTYTLEQLGNPVYHVFMPTYSNNN